jgi:hypothetical protein
MQLAATLARILVTVEAYARDVCAQQSREAEAIRKRSHYEFQLERRNGKQNVRKAVGQGADSRFSLRQVDAD